MSKTVRNEDTFPSQFGQGDPSDAPRTCPSSALNFFANAKSKIIDIFRRLATYVIEAEQFLKVTKGEQNEDWENIHSFNGIANDIIEKLTRDHMKVVFVGRTSYGKSTVINAMLHNTILTMGTGKTTNCFLQIEGTDESKGYLLTENSKERLGPGIDENPSIDKWIHKYCSDADVFVLVTNAESTLSDSEKSVFRKLNLSKPNIFILLNKWDNCEEESDVDKIKAQHYTKNVEFLTKELKVADEQAAKKRIYFVSAKEALNSRLPDKKSKPAEGPNVRYEERLSAFNNFERDFKVCISNSAVQIKFQKHLDRGKEITAELKDIMEKTYSETLRDCEDKRQKYTKELKSLEHVEQLPLLKVDVEEVKKKVSYAVNDEIQRIQALVDEFSMSCIPPTIAWSEYKKKLDDLVKKGLGNNLQERCSSILQQTVETTQKNMTDMLAARLNEEKRIQLINVLPKENIRMSYKLDCEHWCSDFQENIRFRFSLVSRLMSLSGTPTTARAVHAQYDNPSLMVTAFATLGVITAGLVIKVTGWKVVAAVSSLMLMLYLYEWLCWTNETKENKFKSKYVQHATSKLRLTVHLACSNWIDQVQRELSSRLRNYVDLAKNILKEELQNLKKEIRLLEDTSKQSKGLRDKADCLGKELNTCKEEFKFR